LEVTFTGGTGYAGIVAITILIGFDCALSPTSFNEETV